MADNSNPCRQSGKGWSLKADLTELEGRSGQTREEFDQAAIAVIERHPDKARGYCRIARLYDQRGEPAKGLDFLDRGLQRMAGDLRMLKLGAVISRKVPDFERAILYHQRQAELAGHRVPNMVAIARLSLKMRDGAGAWEALEQAVAAGHDRDELRLSFARAALQKDDRETCRALVDEEERLNGPSPELTSIATKLTGREDMARARSRIPQRLGSNATAEIKEWARARQIPTGSVSAFPDHFITEQGDIVAERVHGSHSLVLAFSGMRAAGTLPTLNAVLEQAHINSLLLSDPQRLLLLGGIGSIGNYQESIAWLRHLVAAWQISELYCFGTSAGGYSAIRYGLELGARRILTFAAPTKITNDLVGGNEDKRARAVLGRLLRHAPEMCTDLRVEIARRGEAAPEIINYYGADMPQDAFHARNIASLPTVQSRPLAGLAGHDAGRHLKATGGYAQAFEEFLRDRK